MPFLPSQLFPGQIVNLLSSLIPDPKFVSAANPLPGPVALKLCAHLAMPCPWTGRESLELHSVCFAFKQCPLWSDAPGQKMWRASPDTDVTTWMLGLTHQQAGSPNFPFQVMLLDRCREYNFAFKNKMLLTSAKVTALLCRMVLQ